MASVIGRNPAHVAADEEFLRAAVDKLALIRRLALRRDVSSLFGVVSMLRGRYLAGEGSHLVDS